MGDRWQRFVAEVGRFLTVGLVATVVALVLFNVLVHGFGAFANAPLNDQPELAYLLANSVSMLISFRGNKTWAFRDREARHPDGGVVAFVTINLVTMLIPIACLWTSRHLLGLDDPISDNVAANVIGLLLGSIARFLLFRYYVFHRPSLPFHLHLAQAEVERELGGPALSEPPAEAPTDRSRSDRVPPSAP